MEEEKWVSDQKQLFSLLKVQLRPHEALVDEVADALGIGQDSAYRRLRAEKPLSWPELAKLAKRFSFSLDELFGLKAQSVSFQFKNLTTAEDFYDYIHTLKEQLKGIVAIPGSKVFYGAADVPVFLHFQQPEHAAFKLYYWQQAVMQLPELKDIPFHPDRINPDVLHCALELGQYYRQVSSVEIWTEESVITTVRQIKYYLDAGLFEHPSLGILVAEQYLELLKLVKLWAGRSYKDEGNQFGYQLFESDISIGNNCVLADVDGKKMAYVRHQTFNTMLTANEKFCIETEQFLKGLLRQSNMISVFA
jgi:hypothetical protein